MDRTDQQLLSDYSDRRSESAFAEIVERYLDLVYSVARRVNGDAHAAEDVAQATFLALAHNASKLKNRCVLAGWLHRTARNLAVKTVRTDVRRRAREQQAAAMNEHSLTSVPTSTSTPSPFPQDNAWDEVAPLLDSALGELNETDRDVILLRFFQRKTDQEIGVLMGLTEAAAQKRVSRAVERLRKSFAKRRVPLSAGGLAVAISARAIESAPAGLATAISATAAAALPGTAAIGSPPFLRIAMNTLKAKHVAFGLIGVLLASTAWLSYRNASLRHQLENARAQAADPTSHSGDAAAAPDVDARISAEDRQRRRMQHLELLSMRGRVALLSRELRERAAIRDARSQSAQSDEPGAEDSILFSASATNQVPPGNSIVVGGWRHQQLRGYLLLTPAIARGDTVPEDERLTVKSLVLAAPENFWAQIGWADAKSDSRRSTLSGLLTSAQVDTLLQALKETPGAEISNESVARGADGERLGIGFSTEDEKESGVLMAVDVYPRISSNTQSVDLEIHPSVVPASTPIHPSLSRSAQPYPSLTH